MRDIPIKQRVEHLANIDKETGLATMIGVEGL
jgi:hypothetical protein